MAVDVGAVVLKLKAGDVELAKYAAAAKELDNKMKKKMAEFQLINQSLWEGSDHIKELEKELAAAKETFNKMVANKITPITKELSGIGQTAANTATMAQKLEAQAKTLHGEIDAATGDVAKKHAAYEHAKKLEKEADKVFVELNAMKQEIAGLPKTPKA